MRKFWLVWTEGGSNPTFKHPTEHDARMEAERLSRMHGGIFVVLEAVAAVKKSDVQWRELHESDEFCGDINIPF